MMETYHWTIIAILGVKLVSAVLLMAAGKTWIRTAKWVVFGASLTSMGLTFSMLPVLSNGMLRPLEIEYLPLVGIRLGLNLDWISFPFLLTEEFVTFFAIFYGLDYLKEKPNQPLFYGLLLLFAAGMSGTTLANDIFLFYLFWELMLIASALLILNWGDGKRRVGVTLKYFIITHLGSLLVLVGFVILYSHTGMDYFSAMQTAFDASHTFVPLVSMLFLIGFCVKMAIVPVHIWLPDAHSVAPMPVTIMLAAAMLSMGTYGILRFPLSFISMEQFSHYGVYLMVFGVLSEIYGALMALAEKDIKRIIAYSSVSQMGYILFGLGTLTSAGLMGATLHVIYHAIVKALLFCCVGNIIAATGKRQIDELGGLWGKLGGQGILVMIGVLSFAGLPALAVFNSEWLIFSSGFQTPYTGLAVLEILGSILTAGYGLRFLGLIFFNPGKVTEIKPIPFSMRMASFGLAALTVIAGLFPKPIFNVIANEIPLLLGGMLK